MGNPFDIHQHVTDQIVAMLDATRSTGTGTIRLPWHRPGGNSMRPVNVTSGKPYRGVNILTLWATAQDKGFTAGTWGTYRQWAQAGAQVRRGEKAAFVVVYKEIVPAVGSDAAADEREDATLILFARASPVFAAEQVDGWAGAATPAPPTSSVTTVARAEAFVTATGATVRHGGTHAFYQPATDTIQLPPRALFTGTPTSTAMESYYAVLLHELTHWTGHPTRCNRQLGCRFGADAYAMEELVAELGAAFACAELDLTPEPRADHAHYLDHWLSVMKADKRAVFTAASKASEAATFLADLTRAAANAVQQRKNDVARSLLPRS